MNTKYKASWDLNQRPCRYKKCALTLRFMLLCFVIAYLCFCSTITQCRSVQKTKNTFSKTVGRKYSGGKERSYAWSTINTTRNWGTSSSPISKAPSRAQSEWRDFTIVGNGDFQICRRLSTKWDCSISRTIPTAVTAYMSRSAKAWKFVVFPSVLHGSLDLSNLEAITLYVFLWSWSWGSYHCHLKCIVVQLRYIHRRVGSHAAWKHYSLSLLHWKSLRRVRGLGANVKLGSLEKKKVTLFFRGHFFKCLSSKRFSRFSSGLTFSTLQRKLLHSLIAGPLQKKSVFKPHFERSVFLRLTSKKIVFLLLILSFTSDFTSLPARNRIFMHGWSELQSPE